MTFFESLLVLMLAALFMLQVARRLALPYPAMLAAAGLLVALIPGAPTISFAPTTALALFIAPALVDSAYDFPIGAARRYIAPLVMLAVFAVIATTAAVAWLGVAMIGLPLAAAIALGALVAPPDAAAATAVLNTLSVPRDSNALLRGESLFNDATALLLYSGALAVLANGALDGMVSLRLGVAAPGGILFGILFAKLVWRFNRYLDGTLGGNLSQFVYSFLVWIIADHLGLSAVLSTAAFAMTLATIAGPGSSVRMRVHSFAVWRSIVFSLNVFAFLLMGMQARTIITGMPREHLEQAAIFASAVVAAVIVVRLTVAIGFNRVAAWWYRRHNLPEPASLRQAIFVGWSGMRGFVTLATAFALPDSFPHRDTAVLTAFTVVLATLVIQGMTLAPLIRLLGLNQRNIFQNELAAARVKLGSAALESLDHDDNRHRDALRLKVTLKQQAYQNEEGMQRLSELRQLGRATIAAQRKKLELLKNNTVISADIYILLQEELDWEELTLLSDEERRIEDG